MDLVAETGKLVVQVGAAIFVARLAVIWALERYKAEKLWDRRLAAYSDVVASLSEMRKIVSDWADEVLTRTDSAEEVQNQRREGYQFARRRLDEVLATGQLLLPEVSQDALVEMDLALGRYIPNGDAYTHLDRDLDVITKALVTIVGQGRKELGIVD